MIIYTLGKLWTFTPINPTSHKKICLMMSFFVMPEDIWVEESFAAEWAHQPHS